MGSIGRLGIGVCDPKCCIAGLVGMRKTISEISSDPRIVGDPDETLFIALLPGTQNRFARNVRHSPRLDASLVLGKTRQDKERGDRTYKLPSSTTSEPGRYVKFLGESRRGFHLLDMSRIGIFCCLGAVAMP